MCFGSMTMSSADPSANTCASVVILFGEVVGGGDVVGGVSGLDEFDTPVEVGNVVGTVTPAGLPRSSGDC